MTVAMVMMMMMMMMIIIIIIMMTVAMVMMMMITTSQPKQDIYGQKTELIKELKVLNEGFIIGLHVY